MSNVYLYIYNINIYVYYYYYYFVCACVTHTQKEMLRRLTQKWRLGMCFNNNIYRLCIQSKCQKTNTAKENIVSKRKEKRARLIFLPLPSLYTPTPPSLSSLDKNQSSSIKLLKQFRRFFINWSTGQHLSM